MKKYDPSHDALHGTSHPILPCHLPIIFTNFLVNRVRKTALTLARSQTPQPDLLVVELAALLHDVLDKKYASPAEAADPHAFFRPFFERVAPHVDLLADGRARLVRFVI
jgi:uncharacterized protein